MFIDSFLNSILQTPCNHFNHRLEGICLLTGRTVKHIYWNKHRSVNQLTRWQINQLTNEQRDHWTSQLTTQPFDKWTKWQFNHSANNWTSWQMNNMTSEPLDLFTNWPFNQVTSKNWFLLPRGVYLYIYIYTYRRLGGSNREIVSCRAVRTCVRACGCACVCARGW